jgi:hypothetical protein
MTSLKTLIDYVQDWLEDEGDEPAVIRAINRAIRQVETIKDWEVLKGISTITPDSSGVILEPTRNRVIRHIYPSGYTGLPSFEFKPKAELDRFDVARTAQYKFYSVAPVDTELQGGLLLDVVQNSQTVTEASASPTPIDVSWVGERLLLEGDETLYEITAATAGVDMTVTPDVRVATGSALSCKIRPIGQAKYQLTDTSGTVYTEDVEVHYQVNHPTLVKYTDQLLIPAENMVALLAVKFFLHQTKYDVDGRALNIEFNEAKRVETQQEGTASPEAISVGGSFGVRSRRNNGTIR